MGPMYWMPQAPTKLLKCSERQTNSCDLTETDGCCAIIPCTLCLEFFVSPSTYSYGEAPFSGSSWSGSIGGATFTGYWEQDYQTGECEFVVALDDLVVYRKSCYEGADCRDPSGSVEVTIGEDMGTLTWSVFESRPLEYIQDPDTNCRTYFCDECDCSCECLCVTVSEFISEGVFDSHTGEICDTAYSCDPPVWEGTVGPFYMSIALGRDEYGQCIITPVVDDIEQDSVLFPGCTDAGEVTFTLADTSTVTVRCKKCVCAEDIGNCICGRPLGPTLTLLFASANAPSTVHEMTLTYGSEDTVGIDCDPFTGAFPAYRGTWSGTLALPMGGSRSETLEVVMVCECTDCAFCVYYKFGSTGVWCVTDVVATDCNCPALLTVGTFSNPTCDSWSYQISDITIVELESNC